MPSLVNKWKNHLKENNMTYWGHCVFAVGHGMRCIKAGVYLCIHGIFPCYYRRAGSKLVRHLAKVFTDHDYEIEGEENEGTKKKTDE